MRERLARVLAAISVPPHMPSQYLNQMKARFANLERYFSLAPDEKKVSEAIEAITGYYFAGVVNELPYAMFSLVDGFRYAGGFAEEPLSKRITTFQEFSAMKNVERSYIRSTMQSLTRPPKDWTFLCRLLQSLCQLP